MYQNSACCKYKHKTQEHVWGLKYHKIEDSLEEKLHMCSSGKEATEAV